MSETVRIAKRDIDQDRPWTMDEIFGPSHEEEAALAFNERHPELAAEFTMLTGIDAQNYGAIREWQRAHGLRGDGKVGADTVRAARGDAKAGRGTAETISFEGEGSVVEVESEASVGGKLLENPSLMENILDGAVGQERRESKAESEKLKGTGLGIKDIGEGLHHVAGMEEQPVLKAAMAPAIVAKLREGDYRGAVWLLTRTFSVGEAREGLLFACEKLGIHSGVTWLESAGVVAGTAALGATIEMVLWVKEGLDAIAEAHEMGDRDSRIVIYARAFADGFLHGEKAALDRGVVTEEQRHAAELGRRDGAATAGRTGEHAPGIARQLLRQYGSEDNLRHAIMDGLLAKAGISGIKTHEGK